MHLCSIVVLDFLPEHFKFNIMDDIIFQVEIKKKRELVVPGKFL
jgi:hypothetical protein